MKCITRPLFPVRLFPALCLLAGCLLLPASPALAADKEPAKVPARQTVSPDRALLGELADRVRDRALFAAEIAPKLVLLLSERRYGYRNDGPNAIVDLLWELRGRPDIRKEWLDKLTAPNLSAQERERLFRDFEDFMAETARQAEEMARQEPATGNLWTWFRRNVLGTGAPCDAYQRGATAQTPYLRAAQRLDEVKAREQAFAGALVLTDVYRKADLDAWDAEPYAKHLLKLQDRPDDLHLAAGLIKSRFVHRHKLDALLAMLVKDPAKARKDIAALEKREMLERRYFYVMNDMGANSTILLPVASLLPEAAKAVEKAGTVPLNAGKGNAGKRLTSRRLERLLPEEVSLLDGGMPQLPFLAKGERLYVITWSGQGLPGYRDTPLEIFAPLGSDIVELTRDNFDMYMSMFTDNRNGWFDAYLIAAVCSPEELASHIASVSVVFSAREQSLYGAFEDYERTPDPRRLALYAKEFPDGFPKDTPGQAFRLTRPDDAAFFPTLAPLADEAGLARLLGPIRGIWTANRAAMDGSWMELRYAPADNSAKAGKLGASPVLSLEKPALEAFIKEHELSVIIHLTDDFLYESCRDNKEARLKKFPATLEETRKKFDAVKSRGFVSPYEVGTALRLLTLSADDPEKLSKIRAILDDTSQSAAERRRAMIKIFEERQE